MNTQTNQFKRASAILFSAAVFWLPWGLNAAIADEQQGYSSQSSGSAQSAPINGMPSQIVLSSSLIGSTVRSSNGDELGRIKDIVLTPDQTSASYVVVSQGGFLGVGEQLYAVPWTAINVSSDGRRVTTSINKSEMTKETSFGRLDWPDVGETRWSKLPYNTDDMQTFNPDQGPFQLRRVSQITQLDSGNREGKYLGQLSELGIERPSGKVVYGVVAVGGGLLQSRKMAAVPWDMVTLQSNPAVAGINLDQKQLEAVQFDRSNWPRWNDKSYTMMLYRTFGEEPYQQIYGYAASEERPNAADPWSSESSYNSQFNTSNIQTIHGTVQSLGTFRPAEHGAGGQLLMVRTDDGNIVTVQGGPKPFVTRSGFDVKQGEQVTVTGSKVQMGARDVLMATEISSGDRTLKLRDESGKPVWSSEDLKAKYPAPAGGKVEATQSDYPGGDMGF